MRGDAIRSAQVVAWLGAAVLLAGSTVLAFFSCGFFDAPRLVAAPVAWGTVVLATFVSPRPLPASGPGRAEGYAGVDPLVALGRDWRPSGGITG